MGQSRTALALILCNLFAYLTRRFIFASLDASHGLAIYGDLVGFFLFQLCKNGYHEQFCNIPIHKGMAPNNSTNLGLPFHHKIFLPQSIL
ncbi:hypothetical protein VNO80_20533 [Phaseolus coccineus]|uniref:Uncharacterized protein n=1 Tax=Phaseolus coccineus TaxID=3886 RepID=A0AAN9M0R0_PHACN